jgi:hypothetical protein
MKSFVIPVIIETGIISKSLKNIRNNIRTTLNRFCTKTAVLGTSQGKCYNLRLEA